MPKSPFITQTQYRGMMSLRNATELPVGFCAYSLNGDLGSSSQAAPLPGYSSFGHQTNKNQPTIRKYTYTRGDGTSVMLQVRDDGTNYILEYLNQEDTRNDNNGEWSILEAGLSRSRILLNGTIKKLDFGFESFNDTGTDQCIYGNGVEGIRIWNGCTAALLSSTVNTVTIAGTATLANRGFKTSGSVIINGNTYAYSGISGTSFTGVGTDPTSETANSGVAQSVDTSTMSAVDKGSVFLTLNARLYMAGIVLAPNQVTYSKVGDITSYSGSNPDDGGFEDFPDMAGNITALSYVDSWLIAFSLNRIVAFSFQYPTATTRTVQKIVISDEGCPNQKAVKKIGDRVLYLTPYGGIKQITQIAAKDVFNVEDLTDNIRPTLQGFDWSDGVLEYSSKKRMIRTAGKTDSTQTGNNIGVDLFFTKDELDQPIQNLGIHDWFIGDTCIFNGDIHFGSSLDCQDMLAFDGYTKNGAPYKWKRSERRELFSNAWEKKRMPYFAVRGAIDPGTILPMTLKYNINGSLTVQPFELRGDDERFVSSSTLNMLGGFELGSEPLGGTMEDIGDLRPFQVIFPLPEIYFRDIQLEYEVQKGMRVMVDTHAYYVEDAGQEITYDELKELGTTPTPIPTLN